MVLWRPRVATMEDFRRDIAARPDEFLALMEQTRQATGMDITADLYKRPKPTDNPALEPYFAWKCNIGCVREEAPGENLFTPELAQRVGTFLEQLTPLYEYLNRFKV
jgi:uncharacterized protein (DUF2461 family)